jgi:hypothetical protein
LKIGKEKVRKERKGLILKERRSNTGGELFRFPLIGFN